ncbi:hypothetical protein, partial [Faecalibacterium sp. An122]|uniref:hypothetical protein n=1 Tax=Faecalibacterium sp. An122 TaxID=1965551 RepID=UPI000B554E06
MTKDLRFDPQTYAVKQYMLDGIEVRCRAFEDIPYCAAPADPIQKLKCDTKSRNVLRVNAALSIWSNPTVTCTGQKPALGSSQDNM